MLVDDHADGREQSRSAEVEDFDLREIRMPTVRRVMCLVLCSAPLFPARLPRSTVRARQSLRQPDGLGKRPVARRVPDREPHPRIHGDHDHGTAGGEGTVYGCTKEGDDVSAGSQEDLAMLLNSVRPRPRGLPPWDTRASGHFPIDHVRAVPPGRSGSRSRHDPGPRDRRRGFELDLPQIVQPRGAIAISLLGFLGMMPAWPSGPGHVANEDAHGTRGDSQLRTSRAA